ncbi:hypothetical protein [Sorangium sp. So ce1078]|uniref:hypothetical protein n=1 Tax=Sorangium sp. So ce1078 TaxID=3133329 RepID=UPI003F5D8F33
MIAMRAGDAPPDLSDRFFGPSGVDPDSLVLFFSSVVQECARPFVAIRCDNAPIWRFILIVPPELDAPGLIDLSDPRIGFDESFAYPDCSGGGASGTGFQGTLEIVSSDETSLFVKLRGASDETLSLDGDYTVERCGAAAAPAPGE